MTNPKLEVLTPSNCQVIFNDRLSQILLGLQSIDREMLKNNGVGLAKAARIFSIPTIITSAETVRSSGHTTLSS